MLDPASIERLAEFPEQNDPLLNVALAEEGGGGVLLALARCEALGPEALDVIASRVAREADTLVVGDEGEATPAADELDQRLVGHPNSPGAVRDDVLGRHPHDPFFVLSAAAHADATPLALEAAASWPSTSPLHDRSWLSLLTAATKDHALLAAWAERGELLREASAWLASDAGLLEKLAGDPLRRVRRAVASNANAGAFRARLATSDPAVEVRARAAGSCAALDGREGGARLSSLLRTMREGGVLGIDTRRALLAAGPELDEEGAFLAARYLPPDELRTLIAQATNHDPDPLGPRARGVGVGFGVRSAGAPDARGTDDALLSTEIVHVITRRPNAESRLTGKARVAHWISDCLGRSRAVEQGDLARLLGPGTLASDRMVLRRWSAETRTSLASTSLLDMSQVPAAVVELCWRDPSISDDAAVALAARVAATSRSERELPEDDLDLAPLARPLPVLERAVLAAVARAPVAPRAALAAIALEPRRCRYVLSAMPTWKGALTGARLARVLKSHAGALSAAQKLAAGSVPSGGAKPATIARWTDRKLIEAEAAIAIAVGDLTAEELVRRLAVSTIKLEEGVTLAAGIEARVAIDGAHTFTRLLDYATSRRTADPAALALWVLLEELDRVRAPSLIASTIDGLSVSGSVVSPAVCEALATLERRAPGRLENVHAQSPRGRATIASAIARAYRAFGGMRDEAG
jgi:hypothetical protein